LEAANLTTFLKFGNANKPHLFMLSREKGQRTMPLPVKYATEQHSIVIIICRQQ